MFNPEPQSITKGRHFLYDANSTHGTDACASCHIFGDFDSLAWDLGDPDGIVAPIPGPFTIDPAIIAQLTGNTPLIFGALKGPMTTQSLRGMANHGPMHWRGDRTGGTDASRLRSCRAPSPIPGTFDENAAFNKFNVAFPGLVGSAAQLSDADMQAFSDFILQVTYPPNPVRNLDNSLTPAQAAGRAFFFNQTPDGQEIPSDTFHNCNGCHVLDPNGNAQYRRAQARLLRVRRALLVRSGDPVLQGPPPAEHVSEGRDVRRRRVLQPERHERDRVVVAAAVQRRVVPGRPGARLRLPPRRLDRHDVPLPQLHRVRRANGADPQGAPPNPGGIPVITDPTNQAQAFQQLVANITIRRELEAFMLAFDSNLAPIVGQQATLTAASGADVQARIDLLEARAAAGECDLVAKGMVFGVPVAFLYAPATGDVPAEPGAREVR